MTKTQNTRPPAVWDMADVLDRVDNDQELLRDLLSVFQEEFPRAFRSLQAAVASGDLKNTATFSHKLKGMLSNLGGTQAAEAAARLEALASSNDKPLLDEAFASLERESAKLQSEFKAYLAEVRS